MDDMIDIFQRTCIRKGTAEPVKVEEIEVVSSGSEPHVEEEECVIEEEQVDKHALLADLDCLRRCILKMQIKLKALEKRGQKNVTEVVPLSCAEKKEVCDLQKVHHTIQCQITELIRCFGVAKEYLRDLRMHMCDKAKEVDQLVEYIELLEYWKVNLAPEFGTCKQRYEYLKCAKAEWSEFSELMEKRKINCESLGNTYVTVKTFVKERSHFTAEINKLKTKIAILYRSQKIRFTAAEDRLKAILASRETPIYLCTEDPRKQNVKDNK